VGGCRGQRGRGPGRDQIGEDAGRFGGGPFGPTMLHPAEVDGPRNGWGIWWSASGPAMTINGRRGSLGIRPASDLSSEIGARWAEEEEVGRIGVRGQRVGGVGGRVVGRAMKTIILRI